MHPSPQSGRPTRAKRGNHKARPVLSQPKGLVARYAGLKVAAITLPWPGAQGYILWPAMRARSSPRERATRAASALVRRSFSEGGSARPLKRKVGQAPWCLSPAVFDQSCVGWSRRGAVGGAQFSGNRASRAASLSAKSSLETVSSNSIHFFVSPSCLISEASGSESRIIAALATSSGTADTSSASTRHLLRTRSDAAV